MKMEKKLTELGYDINDYEVKNERIDSLEEDEDEEQLLKRIERDALLHTYYGETRKTTTKPKRPVYIFSPEDLDNELLIDQVETIPTAKRTREQLQRIKEYSQPQ